MSALQSISGKSHAASAEAYDVVVVGAGFAGMYMLHRLRGLGFSVRVYEQGGDVGGTWYWNRYPGARCDVESMQYSYSFSDELQQEWDWSERYAPQPEILKYANHVADRFDLRPDIQFNTRVDRAAFDEDANLWSVTTSDGKTVTAKYVVLATGCLSNARMPDIKGLTDFKGKVYHTGHWPHEPVDFTGQRVGVIGTGSSAIQSVPVIAEQAQPSHGVSAHREFLHSRPQCAADGGGARGVPRELSGDPALCARGGAQRHLYRRCPTAARSTTATTSGAPNTKRAGPAAGSPSCRSTTISRSTRRPTTPPPISSAKRSPRSSSDPETAKLLQPNNHPIGSKRICIDTDYFATFNRPNVTLVDIRSNPIEEITAERGAHRRQGLRGRCAGAGDRLRRHDGLGGQDRHSRPRRADAEPEMGRGAARPISA